MGGCQGIKERDPDPKTSAALARAGLGAPRKYRSLRGVATALAENRTRGAFGRPRTRKGFKTFEEPSKVQGIKVEGLGRYALLGDDDGRWEFFWFPEVESGSMGVLLNRILARATSMESVPPFWSSYKRRK